MTNQEKMEKIFDAIDDAGMRLNDCGGGEYEIEFSSDAGEDVIVSLNTDGTAGNFVQKLFEYAADFDADEHVEELIEAKRNGFQGVPSISVLVRDAASIQEYLDGLAEKVQAAVS